MSLSHHSTSAVPVLDKMDWDLIPDHKKRQILEILESGEPYQQLKENPLLNVTKGQGTEQPTHAGSGRSHSPDRR